MKAIYGDTLSQRAVNIRGKVAIVDYGETPVDRRRDAKLTIEQYYAWAMDLLLKRAGITKSDLDGQGVALLEPQKIASIWSMQMLQELGLRPRVVVRSDHGGAGSLIMLEQAAAIIASGIVDLFLCIAADPVLTYTGHGGAAPQTYIDDYMKPYGMMGPNSLFALVARRYIDAYGVRPEQVAQIAITQRHNASLNPIAYLKREITLEDYLEARMISDPIRLLDCCIPVNGGLAFLLASTKKAKQLTEKPVYPIGLAASHNYRGRDITETGLAKAAKEAFTEARVKREDISFAEMYDDYTYAVLMQLENCGFCSKGKGADFIEQKDISLKGSFPINTGGGQLSSGQAGSGGSFLPLVEALRQMRNEGGRRQIRKTDLAFVTVIGAIGHWDGGFVNTAACILSREP